MNARRQRFVAEYLIDLNATQAAIRAGYRLGEWETGIGFYVYALINPLNKAIIYVGKGKNRRCFAHFSEWRRGVVANSKKFRAIGALVKDGVLPEIAILEAHLVESEAYKIEREFIQGIGRDNLTNEGTGQHSSEEKARTLAAYLYERIAPFEFWLSLAPRTERQIEFYHLIKHHLNIERLREPGEYYYECRI